MTKQVKRRPEASEAVERVLVTVRWAMLAALLLGFLASHGCHGPHDEDTELRLLRQACSATN